MTSGEEPEQAAEPPAPRVGATTRARDWVTATPYRLPLALAAVGLVLSAPFGGWRTAESDDVSTAAPEEVVKAPPFELTLERAYFSASPSESFAALDEGQQYVVVLGTLTSRHETTVEGALLTGAVQVTDLPEAVDPLGEAVGDAAARPELYSAQDSRILSRIGPDLTYDIGLVYRTAAESLPQELTFTVSGYTWRPDAFTREEGWHDPEALTEIVVPLAPQDTSEDSR